MVSQGQQQTTRGTEEKFLTGPEGSTWHASRDHRGRSRQSAKREARPGHMPLLGSLGGVFWGSRAKLLVNSNQKSRVFAKLCWGLIKRASRKGNGRQETADQKGCRGSHFRNFHLLVTLRTSIQGMHLHKGVGVSLRSPKAAWPNKMIAEAAIPWSSLAKLNKAWGEKKQRSREMVSVASFG